MFWFPFPSRIFHEHFTTKQSNQQATYDRYIDRYTNLFKYSFNKVIKCLQSVRNIAENPPCALRSRKLFFLQFCALLSFDILTRRTKDTDVYSIHHHPIWFFRSIEYTMWRFYEGKKMTGLTSCWLRANTWKSSIKRQKKTLSRPFL